MDLTHRLMSLLVRRGDELLFPPDAVPKIPPLIAEVVRSRSARFQLNELLRLAAALVDDGGREAADVILDAIAGVEDALAMLGIVTDRRARRCKTRFARFRAEPRAVAPRYGATAPEGSLELKKLIEPDSMRAAAIERRVRRTGR